MVHSKNQSVHRCSYRRSPGTRVGNGNHPCGQMLLAGPLQVRYTASLASEPLSELNERAPVVVPLSMRSRAVSRAGLCS
jgi:hypothetical protein